MTYVAAASRSSREAWAAIRDLRLRLRPAAVADGALDLDLHREVDHEYGVERGRLTGLDEQRDVVHHDGAQRGGRLELSGPSPHQRVHDRLERRRAVPRRRTPGRRAAPGRARRRRRARPSPNSATTAASPGVPGATTSRASASASTTTAPMSRRTSETVLLPEATPPVIPTRTLRTLRRGLVERPDKCLSYRAPSTNRHNSQTKGSFSESDQEQDADGRRNRHHRSRGQHVGPPEPGRHKRPCARSPFLEHHRQRVSTTHPHSHRRPTAQRQGGRQGHPQRPDRAEQGRHPLPASPRARGARQL